MDKAVICPGCGCAQENNVQNNVQGNSVPQIKEALSETFKRKFGVTVDGHFWAFLFLL